VHSEALVTYRRVSRNRELSARVWYPPDLGMLVVDLEGYSCHLACKYDKVSLRNAQRTCQINCAEFTGSRLSRDFEV